MKFTHQFTDAQATSPRVSGGKGANLALLTQRGFPVPPGFIVGADAYRQFIGANGAMADALRDLPFENPGRLRAATARLGSKFAKLHLPAELESEIKARLSDWPRTAAFSVRSSSTMEDLATAAFAGQHETYLNCSGAELILDKIKACFLSLWSDRAIAYRHQHGFDHTQAAMAVVVQQMVFCDVAGVGFSLNPITGNLQEMVIDANFGLGESVVSGEGQVDHFVWDKASGTLRSSVIARKSRKVVAVESGTAEAPIAAAHCAETSLSGAQLRDIAALLARVEASYRFPQDIEWGIAGGQLFLLQSRPITTIPARWTRDESAERFPNVITPLTWDFVDGAFHRSLDYSFRLMGFPGFTGKWFGMHGHYVYGNQNAVELFAQRASLPVRNLDELRAAIPRLREEFRWVQELPISWLRDLEHHLVRMGAFMNEPLDCKSTTELWDFVLAVNRHGAEYFRPNIAISITHGALYRVLEGLLQIAVGREASHSLFERLMAFCETKTGMVNQELFELAAMVRADVRLDSVLATRTSREVVDAELLRAFPEFEQRLQRFLRDHGHREMDFDAYIPTWAEAPWAILDNLKLILKTPMDVTPAQKQRELKIRMQEAELELYQRLPPDLRFFFGELLRLARAYTSLDDLEHYQTTRLTPALRRGLRELGHRLVAFNALGEPMDIFFAHQAQIEAAVRSCSSDAWRELRSQVEAQKRAYLLDKARRPEWVLGSEPTPAPAEGQQLSGLAGSPGDAEGPVFRVLDADDFAQFPKGAVLIARTTNPTWTPLFYSAVAVVTESGGPLSHGAVTAREMRIPAVMAVRDVLSHVKNGQRVRVDGSQGKVYVLGE